MKKDDGLPDADADTYATRAVGPGSLEAVALSSEESLGIGSRVVGVSLEELQRSLLDGGFVDAEGLRAALARTPTDDRWPVAEGLARHLVRIGKLTRYQAAALYQGKGKSLLIGPYVVLARLGTGGMGMVFKARLRDGGPGVALKLLPPSASKHPQAVLRFRREAAILEKLNHPNIVSSHDIGAFNGVHYLVMDYVEGSDLDRVVRASGSMKLVKAVDCVIQTARGLAAAHERGIVHRDIKPANLLLDTQGVVRILDLGLARITRGDDPTESEASAASLTASGIIMGTVDFLPPEQSDDSKRADHRADIYSLGCTLHYLLTGKPPYSGETLMQKLLAHHQKPIPSLGAARPDVPLEIDRLFQKMLAKSPDDRPSSMIEVLRSLEAWRDWNVGAKSRRVFDGPSRSKGSGRLAGSKTVVSAEGTSTYDLVPDSIRDGLFEPETGPEIPFEGPEPIPTRKSRKARSLRRKADLALRGLVAAASVVVLIKFFPKLPVMTEPAASSPVSPPPKRVKPPDPVFVPPPSVEPVSLPPTRPDNPEPPRPGRKRPPRPGDGPPGSRPMPPPRVEGSPPF